MSPLPVPTKTSLGQAALRRRTGEIGPRHRTLLFLVDGRRPLSEVLSLAHQAGSATSHFEDLVRMGYVELPQEALAPSPVEAPQEVPPPAEITELAVEVDEAAALVEDRPPAAAEAVAVVEVAAPVVAEPPAAPPAAAPAPAQTPAPAPARAPARRSRAAALVDERPAAVSPVHAEDIPMLEQARGELLECLRCDAQPNGARLAERARAARSGAEMVEVVWTMERGLHHHQRSHRGLIALQRTRELLGLGNTLVDEDSTPGLLDEDW